MITKDDKVSTPQRGKNNSPKSNPCVKHNVYAETQCNTLPLLSQLKMHLIMCILQI